MGEIVLAAKNTHVPSIWLSEVSEKHRGIRQNAIDGLREIGRRARALGVDTFVVIDCHWIVNQGFHINANERFSGRFTSSELPHFIDGLEYEYRGDPELAHTLAEHAQVAGFRAMAHATPGLSVEYGTLIPMRHANEGGFARVVPVAANQYADIDEGRRMGAAIAKGVSASGRKVALLASGSLSHAFWPNSVSEAGINDVNGEFNRQVDLRVIELWETGRIGQFLDMLPAYAELCAGECRMIDTAILFGALGWDAYRGKGEVLGHYFGSSGTGQVNVDFKVQGTATT